MIRQEAQRLLEFGLLPIPGADKRPAGVIHKDNKWNRAIARANLHRFEAKKGKEEPSLNILTDCSTEEGALSRLFVLDFDDEVTFTKMVQLFGDTFTGPLAKTKHGHHVYFKRSELCDTLNFTDCARALKMKMPVDAGFPADEKFKLMIDIKTRTSVWNPGSQTWTASVLSVPPSKGKSWIRSIYDTPIPEVPDALLNWLDARRVTGKRHRPTGTDALAPQTVVGSARLCSTKRKEPAESGDESEVVQPTSTITRIRHDYNVQANRSVLRAIGFYTPTQTHSFSNVSENAAKHGYVFGFEFRDTGAQSGNIACPLCNKSDGHTSNNYCVLYKNTGERFIKNLSGSCLDKYTMMPWDETTDELHALAWFARNPTAIYDDGEYLCIQPARNELSWRSKTPHKVETRVHFLASTDLVAMHASR